MSKPFSNHEVVTLAVYLLGGQSRQIDTEDVAIKAHQLAPGRFTWKKYPDQINLEIIRVYLSDAKKSEKGAYLLGSGTDGWLLTEQGLVFAQARVPELGVADLSRQPLRPKERQQRQNERARMLASDAFAKFQAGDLNTITYQEAEAFFRVNDYVVGQARERKVVRIVNTFGDDPDLGEAVRALVSKIRGR